MSVNGNRGFDLDNVGTDLGSALGLTMTVGCTILPSSLSLRAAITCNKDTLFEANAESVLDTALLLRDFFTVPFWECIIIAQSTMTRLCQALLQGYLYITPVCV